MNDSSTEQTGSGSDFFRHWQDSFNRIWQAASNFTPETMPPDMMRQIRGGIFQALAKSWEEFMRTPQFTEGMKQMMDNAIAFRQMTSDFLTRARQETQGTSRQDVDDVLMAMREMEARLTRRVDELSAKVKDGEPAKPARTAVPKPKSKGAAKRKAPRKRK